MSCLFSLNLNSSSSPWKGIYIFHIVALQPVELLLEHIVKMQFLTCIDVLRGHQCNPHTSPCLHQFDLAVGILLVSVIRESHQVSTVDCVHCHVFLDIKAVRPTQGVIHIVQKVFEKALPIENLTSILNNEIVLFQILECKQSDNLVAQKGRGSH